MKSFFLFVNNLEFKFKQFITLMTPEMISQLIYFILKKLISCNPSSSKTGSPSTR